MTSPRASWWLTPVPAWMVALGLLAAAAIDWVNGARYGIDIGFFVLGAHRFMAGAPLYEGSGPAFGMIGPPFQALVFVPLALVDSFSVGAARVLWGAVSFAALVFGARAWGRAIDVPASSPLFLASAAAVAFPIYREFQIQNMTLLMFWMLGMAADAWRAGRTTPAGVWVGVATAIKLFPGLAIPYFAARAKWGAFIAATVATGVLTLLPLPRYGVSGSLELWREWLRTRHVGDWPSSLQNQSLSNAIGVLFGGSAGVAVGLAAAVLVVAVLLFCGWRMRRSAITTGSELALVLVAAILTSPIAWIFYSLLAMPALAALGKDGVKGDRASLVAALAAGALMTPLAAWRRNTPGPECLVASLIIMAALARSLLRTRPT